MIKKITNLVVLLLVSGGVFAANSNGITPNQNKAYRTAYCAATMSTTGYLKIANNRQTDYESINLIASSFALLDLSRLYSSESNALSVFGKTQTDIFNRMSMYSNGDMNGLANFVYSYLAPINEKCLPEVKDVISHTALIKKYAASEDGKAFEKVIDSRMWGKPENKEEKKEEVKQDVETKPILVSCPKSYPPEGQGAEIAKSTAKIRVIVDPNGKVLTVSIITGSGYSETDTEAVKSSMECIFKPATKAGKPVQGEFITDVTWDDRAVLDKYESKIKSHIKRLWRVPVGSTAITATAHFTLSSNGSIASVVITQSSGNDAFDTSIKVLRGFSGIPVPNSPELFNRVKDMDIEFKAVDSDIFVRKDVREVMSQNASSLQSVFSRTLAMSGDFTVYLNIAPDGKVIRVSIISSDLNNRALEGKLKAMIQEFQFSSGDFDIWEGNYKYNFVQ